MMIAYIGRHHNKAYEVPYYELTDVNFIIILQAMQENFVLISVLQLQFWDSERWSDWHSLHGSCGVEPGSGGRPSSLDPSLVFSISCQRKI